MEFDFAITGLQGGDITIWDADSIAHLNSVDFHKFRNVLEVFGQKSAAAQNLRAAITDIWRLRSSDQRLYLYAADGTAIRLLGGLKVGKKKLFIHRANGVTVEIEPLCVLDFYVHESCQRQGVGRALLEHMLRSEQLTAEQLAYDRPSPKLLSFLHKHYGLASYIPQSNNFVVFEAYFQHHSASPGGTRRLNRGSSSSKGCTAVRCAATCSWGNGHQNVNSVGLPAATESNFSAESWVPTSLRPPTPSLQQSVQLQPASSVADTCGWQAIGTSAASLGGSGWPAAGLPTSRQQTRYGHFFSGTATQQPPLQQQQQHETVTSYVRGAGYKALDRGQAGKECNTFKGYEQALLAPAGNPAPPAGLGTVRDSLDQFSSLYDIGAHMNSSGCMSSSSTCRQQPGDRNCGQVVDDSYTQEGGVACVGNRRDFKSSASPAEKYPLTPYGVWEPQPGVTLVSGNETKRLSVRQQQEQQQQQQQQQHMAKQQGAGAGPPGHLLTAPTNSYAVPTAGMAELLSSSQQQDGDASAVALDSLISWNGLPVSDVTRLPQQQGMSMQTQQQQYRCSENSRQRDCRAAGSLSQQNWYRQHSMQQLNVANNGMHGISARSEYSSQSSRADSGGGVTHGGLDYGTAKAAAAVFRAGSGAASCLRMT